MLQSLRNLKPETKKKVVLVVASTLTFFVFVFWVFNFFGVFLNTVSDTATKGASVYNAFEQNIEKVYNSMVKMVPESISGKTSVEPGISQEVSTTTELKYDGGDLKN